MSALLLPCGRKVYDVESTISPAFTEEPTSSDYCFYKREGRSLSLLIIFKIGFA